MRPLLMSALAVVVAACTGVHSPDARSSKASPLDAAPAASPAPAEEDEIATDRRPNPPRPTLPDQLSFLFITVDTLRPDLGYAGYSRPVSPNIDEIAKKATHYERAYSISTYTAYAVPPMMASRYPSEMPRSDRHEVRYFGSNVMLAERLHDAGFRTAGAASHFLFSHELGWVDGIERFVMTGARRQCPSRRAHRLPPLVPPAGRRRDPLPRGSRDRLRPVLHLGPLPRPAQEVPRAPGVLELRHHPRALYDGEIAFTDHHIGRVLHALAASPAARRTAVVFTGDHGEAFGEHGFSFHGREIWDEVVRIPSSSTCPASIPMPSRAA